jgi:plasmid segregation protein ParM
LNILGIDIGYSNLKLAFSKSGDKPKTILRPAGAAPADRFGNRFDGKVQADFLHVLVGDEEFVAGVSPDRAEMWTRSLHADYSSSHSYKALFHAGLLLSEMDRIDTLVTGLPVSQYLDENRKKVLVEQMQGTHQVTPKRAVTAENVKVVPQPIGGFSTTSPGGCRHRGCPSPVIDQLLLSRQGSLRDLHRQSSGTSLNT